ncbi:site-specific integrase [Bacillus thuringiensis]|uniref:Integrase n=2 Tax=Bacillus thuringiensis TaxID=1428 RepID=A0A9W3JF47_BACTU|nr:site-specific integrase [Bacillus thuringiensis]EEM37629.1 Transposition regulatory protein tnpA [Bacillus thuringiensis serovar sotto str. T04001]AFQ18898.1 integrase [Bacillus thuringiensis HD-771]MEB4890778.1 site-specific integrase [Bacillus thuringiensis]MEC2563760.1 site-specific integrase [Bacillus thuringiensis]MEC2722021.1 site-specific integrase [Bacillus thuringiensis]
MQDYGLKVEKALMPVNNSFENERIQYLITEDGVPLYEVNRWLELVSINSYLTGETYAYKLLSYLRFLKANKLHYLEVKKRFVLEEYIKSLVFEKNQITHINDLPTSNKTSSSVNTHQKRKNTKISKDSIILRISVIKNFYNWLEDNDISDQSPLATQNKPNNGTPRFHSTKNFLYRQIWNFNTQKFITPNIIPKTTQNHIKWYTEKEIEQILIVLPTLRDKIIFKISIETGARIGEILGLHLQDFNGTDGIITIKKAPNNENKAQAKTIERDLYISDELSASIENYIRGERGESDIYFSTFLFINYKGNKKGYAVNQRNYLKILKNWASKIGFEKKDIRTHSGRSTHAQILLEYLFEGKVTEHYIMAQMGWKGNINTLKKYTRSYNEKSRMKIAKELLEHQIKYPIITIED